MRINLFVSILLLFIAASAFGQITVNTNFSVASNQPIDTRDTLTNLADTSSVTWKYPGIVTYAQDSSQFWFYDGQYWQRLVSVDGNGIYSGSDTVPDSTYAEVASTSLALESYKGFALGYWPNFPDRDFTFNESGIYYSPQGENMTIALGDSAEQRQVAIDFYDRNMILYAGQNYSNGQIGIGQTELSMATDSDDAMWRTLGNFNSNYGAYGGVIKNNARNFYGLGWRKPGAATYNKMLSVPTDSILYWRVQRKNLNNNNDTYNWISINMEDTTASSIQFYDKYLFANSSPSVDADTISLMVWTGDGSLADPSFATLSSILPPDVVTGGGLTNQLAYWDTDQTIADADISYSSTVLNASALTGALVLPSGSDAQDPIWQNGMLRYNTDAGGFQGYNGVERYLPWADSDNWSSGAVPYSDGNKLTTDAADFFYSNDEIHVERAMFGNSLGTSNLGVVHIRGHSVQNALFVDGYGTTTFHATAQFETNDVDVWPMFIVPPENSNKPTLLLGGVQNSASSSQRQAIRIGGIASTNQTGNFFVAVGGGRSITWDYTFGTGLSSYDKEVARVIPIVLNDDNNNHADVGFRTYILVDDNLTYASQLDSAGLILPLYGDNTLTGTPSTWAAWDTDGRFIETTAADIVAAGGAGNVSGSGTENYLPHWDATGTTLVNSNIYESNNTLYPRHVRTQSGYYIEVSDKFRIMEGAMTDSRTGIGVLGGPTVLFYTNGSEKGRIKYSGEWSFGTTATTGLVNIGTDGLYITPQSSDPVQAKGLLYYDTDGNGFRGGDGSSFYYLPWSDAASWAVNRIPYSDGNKLVTSSSFYYKSGELYINQGGDAGNFKLQVGGNIYAAADIWPEGNIVMITDGGAITGEGMKVQFSNDRLKLVHNSSSNESVISFENESGTNSAIIGYLNKVGGSSFFGAELGTVRGMYTDNIIGFTLQSNLNIRGSKGTIANRIGGNVVIEGGIGSASDDNSGNVVIRSGPVSKIDESTYTGIPGKIQIQTYPDTTTGPGYPRTLVEYSATENTFNQRYFHLREDLSVSRIAVFDDDTLKYATPTSIVAAGGAGNVSGSGVANQVAYWDGTNSLTGNSNFLWNGSELLLGTADLGAYRLQVDGDVIFQDSGEKLSIYYSGQYQRIHQDPAYSSSLGLIVESDNRVRILTTNVGAWNRYITTSAGFANSEPFVQVGNSLFGQYSISITGGNGATSRLSADKNALLYGGAGNATTTQWADWFYIKASDTDSNWEGGAANGGDLVLSGGISNDGGNPGDVIAAFNGSTKLGNLGVGKIPEYTLDIATGGLRLGSESGDIVGAAGVLEYYNWFKGHDGSNWYFLPKADAASFTANRIPYSDGSKLIQSSTMTYDGTKLSLSGSNVASNMLYVKNTSTATGSSVQLEGRNPLFILVNRTDASPITVSYRDVSTSSVWPVQVYEYGPSFGGNGGGRLAVNTGFGYKQQHIMQMPTFGSRIGYARSMVNLYSKVEQVQGSSGKAQVAYYIETEWDSIVSPRIIVKGELDGIEFPDYGAGNITGTPTAQSLSVQSDGKIIERAFSYAEMYIDDADPDTLLLNGGIVKPLDVTGGTTANFTMSSARLNYDGAETAYFLIQWDATLTHTVNGTVVEGWIFVNNSEEVGSNSAATITTAGEYETLGSSAIVQLSTNDFVDIYFDADNTTGSAYIDAMKLTITKL